MRIIDCEQGTSEWLHARLGLPTASDFHRIITPAKGQLSASARKYAHQLVAEILLGRPLEDTINTLPWIARGKQLEPQAVQQYEFTMDVETRAVGFITTDDGRMGCSPDRLVFGPTGTIDGGMEIKCTAPNTHIGLLIDGPGDDYRPQVQGQLLITGWDWVDLYGFHPELPPVMIRTTRDEPYIAKMRAALTEFCDIKDAMLMKARASGFLQDQQEAA